MKRRTGEGDRQLLERVGLRVALRPNADESRPFRWFAHVFAGPRDSDRIAVYGCTREGDFYGWGWVALPGDAGREDLRKWTPFYRAVLARAPSRPGG